MDCTGRPRAGVASIWSLRKPAATSGRRPGFEKPDSHSGRKRRNQTDSTSRFGHPGAIP